MAYHLYTRGWCCLKISAGKSTWSGLQPSISSPWWHMPGSIIRPARGYVCAAGNTFATKSQTTYRQFRREHSTVSAQIYKSYDKALKAMDTRPAMEWNLQEDDKQQPNHKLNHVPHKQGEYPKWVTPYTRRNESHYTLREMSHPTLGEMSQAASRVRYKACPFQESQIPYTPQPPGGNTSKYSLIQHHKFVLFNMCFFVYAPPHLQIAECTCCHCKAGSDKIWMGTLATTRRCCCLMCTERGRDREAEREGDREREREQEGERWRERDGGREGGRERGGEEREVEGGKERWRKGERGEQQRGEGQRGWVRERETETQSKREIDFNYRDGNGSILSSIIV